METSLALLWPVLVFNILVAQDIFYIQFQRSGGFTGMSSSIEIDSKLLEKSESEKINQMIDQCDFFEYEEKDSLQRTIPDKFQYVITVEKGDKKRTIKFDEGAIPESFSTFINYLTQQARAAKK